MEMFRRRGLAENNRAAALQSHLSMDIFVILATNERPLVDKHYQSVDQTRAEIRTSNDGTQPASVSNGEEDSYNAFVCDQWKGAISWHLSRPRLRRLHFAS
jgi:hypothetical protein